MWIVMRLYEGIGNDTCGPIQEVELDSDLPPGEMIGVGLASLFFGRDGDESKAYAVEVFFPDLAMMVREGAWYPFDEDDTSGQMLREAVGAIMDQGY